MHWLPRAMQHGAAGRQLQLAQMGRLSLGRCHMPQTGGLNLSSVPEAPTCRSACVYKAMFRGEVVAAKEVDLGRSPAVQAAFLTVCFLRALCAPCRLPCRLPSVSWRRSLHLGTNRLRQHGCAASTACVCMHARRHPCEQIAAHCLPLQEAERLHQLRHAHVVSTALLKWSASSGTCLLGDDIRGSPFRLYCTCAGNTLVCQAVLPLGELSPAFTQVALYGVALAGSRGLILMEHCSGRWVPASTAVDLRCGPAC